MKKTNESLAAVNIRIHDDLEKQRAITLIALVITIIVLLILAGVTISTLTGQNGILIKAKMAKEKQEYESAKEIITMKLMETQTDCIANEETYNLVEIAKKFGIAEETTILKYYNEPTGKVQTVSDSSTVGLNGIIVTVDQYNTYNFLIGESLSIEGVTTDEITDTTAKTSFMDLTTFETQNFGGTTVAKIDLNWDYTKVYAASDGEESKIPVPNNFTVVEGTKSTGIVIKGPDDSEFVWVPVEDAIYDSSRDPELPKNSTTGGSLQGKSYTPMAISTGDGNYSGILYEQQNAKIGSYLKYPSNSSSSYQGSASQYREPALLGSYDTDIVKYNTIGITQESLQSEYNDIINSIEKYKGFYIGRYESSISGETIKSVPGIEPANASKKETYMWYGLYQKEKEYGTKLNLVHQTTINSAMITDACYDAMLNWALTGTDNLKIFETSNGNHNLSALINCGGSPNDKINNIFDLEGNTIEWTSGASNEVYRTCRGGSYGSVSATSGCYNYFPCNTDAFYGSRVILYM